METVADFIFCGSKITADGDCGHEIKRCLLLGRKAMTNISSVHFSHSVVFNSLWPHELQHARPPCPSSTPRVHWNPCPLSQWCHPTVSSSVVPFSSCPQSFPASGSFPVSQLFLSDGQIIGASASASVFLMNIQGWFPLGLTGLISLQSQGLSRVFSNSPIQKHQFFGTQPSLWFNSHIYTQLLKRSSRLLQPWLYKTFAGKVMSLLFNTLFRLVIVLPRSNRLLISQLQPPSEPKKRKSVTASTFFPSICHDVMGLKWLSKAAL